MRLHSLTFTDNVFYHNAIFRVVSVSREVLTMWFQIELVCIVLLAFKILSLFYRENEFSLLEKMQVLCTLQNKVFKNCSFRLILRVYYL